MSGAGSAVGSSADVTGSRGIAFGILRTLRFSLRGQGRKPSLYGTSIAKRVVIAVALVFVVFPSSAVAQKSVVGFIGDRPDDGSTGGVVLGGEFNQPRDVAVNESGAGAGDPGDVYVSESNGNRVQVLDADGNFKFAFGRDVIAAGVPGDLGDVFEICTVAADCKSGAQGTNADGPGGELNIVQGITVDQGTGRVYVQERANSTGGGGANRRIQEFAADGQFLRAWGWDVVVSGPGNTGGFEVCVAANGDVCQAASAGGFAGGQFSNSLTDTTGIVVSPTNSHLFVADPGNRRVLEFDPAATGSAVFVRGWGWDVDKTIPAVGNRFEVCTTVCGAGVASTTPANQNGAFGASSPTHLAVDSLGVVYAADAGIPSTSTQRVLRFDSDPAPGSAGDATSTLLTAIASPPLLSSGITPTIGMEIDRDTDGAGPDEESLLVARDPAASALTVIQEMDIPTAAGETPADPVAVAVTHTFAAASPRGLGLNSEAGLIFLPGVYATPAPSTHGLFVLGVVSGAPVAVVGSPPAIGSESVTLAGSVDPNGFAAYRFEMAEGGGAFEPVGAKGYASGNDESPVSLQVTGLDPNSFYRFRIKTTRMTGLTTSTSVFSNEQIFLTASAPPVVTTLPVGPRGDTTAQLRGNVDPNGTPTTYWFEYGGDTTYGTKIPLIPASAGSGNDPLFLAQDIAGLVPNTSYHYRIVADGAGDPVAGADQTFTTRPTPVAGPELGGRAFELVSPADKIAGIGVGPVYGGPSAAGYAGFAAHEGERFAAMSDYGAMLSGDGAQAYANDWAFTQRVDNQTGWISHSPITHPASAAQAYRWIYVQAATPDLSRVMWRSNGGLLRPFPELAGLPDTNLSFLGDWEGRWEIFGPTDLDKQSVSNSTAAVDGVFSGDGSMMAGSTSVLRGLEGDGDPTLGLAPLSDIRNVYVADVGGQLADNFADTGARVLASVCAGGTVVPAATVGGELSSQACPDEDLVSSLGATQQRTLIGATPSTTSAKGLVSRDGSRVFFMSPDPMVPGVPDGVVGAPTPDFCSGTGTDTVCPAQLFVRHRRPNGDVTTRWISRSRSQALGNGRYGGAPIAGQDASLLGQALFEGASEDGDKVFFRTNSPLTPDDPNGGVQVPGGVVDGQASGSSWDLYMYDFPDDPNADPADGTLTRVSAGPTGASDANNPQSPNFQEGQLRFASTDGSRLYFVTAAPLAGVATAADGTITAPGGTALSTDKSNLYAFDATATESERWRFIARLPRSNGLALSMCATTGTGGVSSLSPPSPAATSLWGFLNQQFGNCVKGTSDGAFVTWFTDGRLTIDDPDGVSGDVYGYDADRDELVRLTAARGGVGGSYPCGTSGVAATTPCYGDGGFGYQDSLSRAPNPSLGVATDPVNEGDRMAFFQSRSRLVPQDTDLAYDVYQWRNGELSLLTPGDSPADNGQMYKGNDVSGRNVYFATLDKMSWQDYDSVLDIYTARVGGGIAEPDPPDLCVVLAGSCHGGGASSATSVVGSGGATSGNAPASTRTTLSVSSPNAAARRRAAVRGVLALRVRSSAAGRVSVVARGRVGGKARRVGGGSVSLSGPGVATVRVRLSRAARGQLASGRALRLSVRVASSGARARSMTVRLERGARS